MSAVEVINAYRPTNQEKRWAVLKDDAMIGVWSESLSRWVAVIAKAITGQWVLMDYEICVNGKLPYTDADWREVLP